MLITKRPGPIAAVGGTNSRTIVTGRASGTFPGSPIDLHRVFTLHRKKIAGQEIS